jgi:hypothetical protein
MRHLLVPDSSNIASIAYDIMERKMQVRFNSGYTYEYEHISAVQWATMCSAVSMGEWFMGHIARNPEHPYRRIQESE